MAKRNGKRSPRATIQLTDEQQGVIDAIGAATSTLVDVVDTAKTAKMRDTYSLIRRTVAQLKRHTTAAPQRIARDQQRAEQRKLRSQKKRLSRIERLRQQLAKLEDATK